MAGIGLVQPDGFLSGALGSGKWWTVPLAVVLAVPMYSNAAGIIPLVEASVQKGVALGTVTLFIILSGWEFNVVLWFCNILTRSFDFY